jgi:hypothetical protein
MLPTVNITWVYKTDGKEDEREDNNNSNSNHCIVVLSSSLVPTTPSEEEHNHIMQDFSNLKPIGDNFVGNNTVGLQISFVINRLAISIL